MLEFVYATDLHGDERKYSQVFKFAVANNIKLIHIGADLLPKGSSITSVQRRFVNGYLKEFYDRAVKNEIKILAFWGNDDLFSFKQRFKAYGELLDETPYTHDVWRFYAYPFVPDYPFGLKDACKLDHAGFVRPEQRGNPLTDINGQLTKIPNIEKYFVDKGTIEEDLKTLPEGNNVIMSIHCPPSNCELDICADMRRVGSISVFQWLMSHNVALCLCGHIHESPDFGGYSMAHVGNNLVIQPGDKRFVKITIDTNNQIAYEIIPYGR